MGYTTFEQGNPGVSDDTLGRLLSAGANEPKPEQAVDKTKAAPAKELAPGIQEAPTPGKVKTAKLDSQAQLVKQVLDKNSTAQEVRQKDNLGRELVVKSAPAAEDETSFRDRISSFLTSTEGRVMLGELGKAFAGSSPGLKSLGNAAVKLAQGEGYTNAEEAIRAGKAPNVKGLSIEQQQELSQLKSDLAKATDEEELRKARIALMEKQAESLPSVDEAFAQQRKLKRLGLKENGIERAYFEDDAHKYWGFFDKDKAGQTLVRIISSAKKDEFKGIDPKKQQDMFLDLDKRITEDLKQSAVGEYGDAVKLQTMPDGSSTLVVPSPVLQKLFESDKALEVYREQLRGNFGAQWLRYDKNKPLVLADYAESVREAVQTKLVTEKQGLEKIKKAREVLSNAAGKDTNR